MDIFSIIKSDHKKVQDTLESMLDTSSGDEQSRRQFTDQLRDLLLPHMSAEEALLYPLLMEEGDPELAMEAIEEHRTAKHVLSELESLSPGDAFWHARCQVLSELIEHHIDVIYCADWIVDLGPEGGADGGELIAAGTPEEVALEPRSHTGRCLAELIGRRAPELGSLRAAG